MCQYPHLQPLQPLKTPVPLSQVRPRPQLTGLAQLPNPLSWTSNPLYPNLQNQKNWVYFFKASIGFSLLINSCPTSLAWFISRFVCHTPTHPTLQPHGVSRQPRNKMCLSIPHTFVLSSPSNRTMTILLANASSLFNVHVTSLVMPFWHPPLSPHSTLLIP